MNILKYKYKAHKLVNTLFYLFVFLIGFVVGFAIKTFNFSNLLSNILMIDNVKAYTLYENSNVKVDEDFVYNGFKNKFPSLDMEDYPYVTCTLRKNADTFIPEFFHCVMFNENSKNNIIQAETYNDFYNYYIPANSYYVFWEYDTSINNFTITTFSQNTSNFKFAAVHNIPSQTTSTNFDFKFATSSQNAYFNKLDFRKYSLGFFDLSNRPTSTNYYNEDYIYNLFNEVMQKTGYDFKFTDYSNVAVYWHTAGVHDRYEYFFSKSNFYNYLTGFASNGETIQFTIDKTNTAFTLSINPTSDITGSINKGSIYTSSSELTGIGGYLDFSQYLKPNYYLNDGSIFEDELHLDFNKVCWQNFKELMFSITINNSYDGSFNINVDGQQKGETYVKSGFYVFDDITNLKRGTRIKVLGAFDYDDYAYTWLSGALFNHLSNITNKFYFLSDDYKILSRYSDVIDALGNYDLSKGDSYYYDNLNKLKNSHYVDFTYYYNVVDDFKYDVFYLNEQKENFCIYIPKQFVVTTLSINELGGFVGDIPIHNNNNDSFIDRTEISGKLHFNNLFSIISQFLSSIRDTVNLINVNIYNFFLSLPPLFQMFIYTILILIVIKTIIWMVVK